MLTENQILENKTKWLELCKKLNFDMTELAKFLEAVDYWHAPYSSQNSYSHPGGLCEYSLKLVNELGTLVNAYFPDRYKAEDILRVGLFKDIYRAELYEPYMKNVKNDKGEWVQEPAFRYRDERNVYGDLNFGSYMTAKNYVDFTDEQIEAIIIAGTKNDFMGDYQKIAKQYPLVILTEMAMKSAYYF